MGPEGPLVFMNHTMLQDERYSPVLLNLEPLSMPHRASHLPPIYVYTGDIHPHRKHRQNGQLGKTYIYILDTTVEGLENASHCGSVDHVPHMPKSELSNLGKFYTYLL